MNSPLRSLGNYDMVLALSASKINAQFKKMYQRKIIHSDWAFLTNSMGQKVETLTNEKAESYWNDLDKNKSDLEAKKASLKSIDQQITAEMDKDEWDEKKLKDLKNQKKSIQAEVNDLQPKVDAANQYDLGLIATIAEPEIEILKDTSKELLFKIFFKQGSTLFYTHEGKKVEYDLGGNGIKYAFRVAIDNEKVTGTQEIIEIDENGNETTKSLKDKLINDNLFTIQSLFLKFEGANIATYDSQLSKLPDNASQNSMLQVALSNYFKNLAKSSNPYVLGYGINKNEVQEGERALLYPSGVAYSTSYNNVQRASTFNFLMLLNNHHFPEGNDAGVLPTSLMEYVEDTTATVNGVFGLNIKEFEDNYVVLLSSLISKAISSNMGSKCESSTVVGKDIHISFTLKDLGGSGTIDLKYVSIDNNGNNEGVDIKYSVAVKANLHQEREEMVGTVGIDWSLSTSGQSDVKASVLQFTGLSSSKGKNGNLIVSLKCGASGRLELKPSYTDQMVLGYDSSEPRYKNNLDKFWDGLNDYLSVLGGNVNRLVGEMHTVLRLLNNMQSLNEGLNIHNLIELENKVILPVASVYTYKNVRVSNQVLLFDISYGTVEQ